MAEPPLSTATLSDMKTRIADELARADLTSQIAYAIADAIDFYQSERFHFNESRSLTFSTVADQEFYTSSDLAAIATMQSFDYLLLYLSGLPYEINRRTPIEIELLNQGATVTGQPYSYSYYNKQIRLGPVPDSVYTIRIAGRITYTAPASDSEASNPWMQDGEKLIRSRAKWELFTHVLRNAEQAEAMKAAEKEAFSQLKGKTALLSGTGQIAPMQF